MEKTIKCTKCGTQIVVSGTTGSTKEVPQGVTCPRCGEPNEVMWPMADGYRVETRKTRHSTTNDS